MFDYDAVYDDLKETKKLSDAKLKNKLDSKVRNKESFCSSSSTTDYALAIYLMLL